MCQTYCLLYVDCLLNAHYCFFILELWPVQHLQVRSHLKGFKGRVQKVITFKYCSLIHILRPFQLTLVGFTSFQLSLLKFSSFAPHFLFSAFQEFTSSILLRSFPFEILLLKLLRLFNQQTCLKAFLRWYLKVEVKDVLLKCLMALVAHPSKHLKLHLEENLQDSILKVG